MSPATVINLKELTPCWSGCRNESRQRRLLLLFPVPFWWGLGAERGALRAQICSNTDWVKCQKKLSVIGGSVQLTLKWVSTDNEGSVIKMMWRARWECRLPCKRPNNGMYANLEEALQMDILNKSKDLHWEKKNCSKNKTKCHILALICLFWQRRIPVKP